MPGRKTKKRFAPNTKIPGAEKRSDKHKERHIGRGETEEAHNIIICFIQKHIGKISLLLAIIAIVFIVLFYMYAKKSQISSEFFGYWSEFLKNFLIAIIGGGVFSFVSPFKFGKYAKWFFAILLICSFIISSLSGILHIKELNAKREEVVQENEIEHSKKKEDNPINKNNNDSEPTQKYYAIPYIFEDDPFFEKKEEYFGVEKGSLSEDEIIQNMAKCIYESIDLQYLDDSKIPEAYKQHTQAANLQYGTYLFQRKRDWDLDGDESNTYYTDYIKRQRIDDLKSVINELITADGEHTNSENRRQIAICYKDLGDEYAHVDNQTEAADCFEECAKWAMKSMHISSRNRNYDDYNITLKQLYNAYEAMISLSAIGESRKDRIKLCYDAYNYVLNTYMSK